MDQRRPKVDLLLRLTSVNRSSRSTFMCLNGGVEGVARDLKGATAEERWS
ncbi:hypothetical protein Syun_016283 [Stephania yunnanensis]|uniref:Uncharacterized protein n=1 Tax=Stephania yunnanensis TaxID=152371 RepID=A0AAP0J789_9MAGN